MSTSVQTTLPEPAMNLSPIDTHKALEAYVDAAAAVLSLPIAAEHRPGVVQYFALAASMAARVAEQPLDPTDEPAPAFVPISPISPFSPFSPPAGPNPGISA